MSGKKPDNKPAAKQLMGKPRGAALLKAKQSARKHLGARETETSRDKHNAVLNIDDDVEIALPDGKKLGSGQYIGRALMDGFVVVAWEEDGVLFVGNWDTNHIRKV